MFLVRVKDTNFTFDLERVRRTEYNEEAEIFVDTNGEYTTPPYSFQREEAEAGQGQIKTAPHLVVNTDTENYEFFDDVAKRVHQFIEKRTTII
jgi:hypothetical protein